MTESIESSQNNWEALQNSVETFGARLESALEELGILETCKNLDIDHICVRLKNSTDVDHLSTELNTAGEEISRVEVNGRPISIIQLTEPLHLGLWQTSAIELPYPKANHSYADGWEHVEFVIGGRGNNIDEVREAFFERFAGLDKETLVEHYEYSEDEPHAEGDQAPNPTIGIKVGNIGIKFHANSIQHVVGYS